MKAETKTNSKPDVVLTLTWEEAVALDNFAAQFDSDPRDKTCQVNGVSIDLTLVQKLSELGVNHE